MKRIISIILICVLSLSVCAACSSDSEVAKSAEFSLPENYKDLDGTLIAENESFTLEWDTQYQKVVLKDKNSENAWSTTPLDANGSGVDEFGFPIEATPRVNSPIMVTTINSETLVTELSMGYTQSITRSTVDKELIENGITVTYYFEDCEIAVPVDYTLTDKGFDITVDPKKITEGKYELYSISIAPYLCSVGCNADNAYLFVPSGNGALINSDVISQEGLYFSDSFYGGDATKQVYTKTTNTKNMNLPVYGYKSGEQGGFVIIKSGAECASLSGYIGSSDIKYSNIGAEFQLRGSDTLKPSAFSRKEGYLPVYADALTQDEIQMSFIALTGEKADYNTMAELYREYLIESGSLKAESSDESLLHLKILGATYEDKSFLGITYKNLYALTTLEDAEEIVEELDDATDLKLSVELKGYGSSGLDVEKIAGDYTVSGKLGGVKQLKSLQSTLTENNIDLYFDFDIASFSKSGSSWSYSRDIPKGPTGLKVYQYQYDTAIRSQLKDSEYALLSRGKLSASADKLLSKIKKWDLSGIGLDSLSNISYSDYRDIKYYSAGGMATDAAEIAAKYKEAGYKVLVNDANGYVAALADEITDTPIQSSAFDVFDAEIPFYQMVFKGYVSMTAESLNNASDRDKALLKAIEGGCGLSYTLVNNYTTSLVNSSSKNLHNSVYSGLKDEIIANAESLQEFYNRVEGKKIVEFELLNDGLHKTTFENGLVLYTNHSENTVATEFGELEKYGYIYKGGE